MLLTPNGRSFTPCAGRVPSLAGLGLDLLTFWADRARLGGDGRVPALGGHRAQSGGRRVAGRSRARVRACDHVRMLLDQGIDAFELAWTRRREAGGLAGRGRPGQLPGRGLRGLRHGPGGRRHELLRRQRLRRVGERQLLRRRYSLPREQRDRREHVQGPGRARRDDAPRRLRRPRRRRDRERRLALAGVGTALRLPGRGQRLEPERRGRRARREGPRGALRALGRARGAAARGQLLRRPRRPRRGARLRRDRTSATLFELHDSERSLPELRRAEALARLARRHGDGRPARGLRRGAGADGARERARRRPGRRAPRRCCSPSRAAPRRPSPAPSRAGARQRAGRRTSPAPTARGWSCSTACRSWRWRASARASATRPSPSASARAPSRASTPWASSTSAPGTPATRAARSCGSTSGRTRRRDLGAPPRRLGGRARRRRGRAPRHGPAKIELRLAKGGSIVGKVVVRFEVDVDGRTRRGSYVAKLVGAEA